MNKKEIDFGEYIIKISYDKSDGELNVEVCDELGEIIESIHIINDENGDDDEPNDTDSFGLNFNLN